MSNGTTKVVGRILYLVYTGNGFKYATVRSWRVSSIQRPPRREGSYWGVSPLGANLASKEVYLREVGGKGKESFLLSEWPGRFAATARAAWRASLPVIQREIDGLLECMASCEKGGADCVGCLDDCKGGVRVLRASLTRAKARSRAGKDKTP